jgi:hypothetical protein
MKSMKVLNPGKLLFEPGLWSEDPVHPTVDGYKKVIEFIVAGLEAASNVEASSSMSTESEGQKRDASEFLAGPDRRPYWVSGAGVGGGQTWTSCNTRQWPRTRGGGWRSGGRMRRGR